MRLLVYSALAAVLAGCGPQADIVDISDSAITVQTNAMATPADAMAEATRGCGLYKRTPTLISERCIDAWCQKKLSLFACGLAADTPAPQ